MFASFNVLPGDNTPRVPCHELLNSHRAMRPHLLNQSEGVVTLFDHSSLSDYFNQRPDGIHTSQEIEAMRLRRLLSPR